MSAIRFIATCILFASSSALAQTENLKANQRSGSFPSGVWHIAPVTPDEAAPLMRSRVVPPSDVPASVGASHRPTEAPERINVEATLGHDLPTEPPPPGFSRADFATKRMEKRAVDRQSLSFDSSQSPMSKEVIAPQRSEAPIARPEVPVFKGR
jgi:hypothetical protein